MSGRRPEHFINRGFGWVCRRCERTGAAPDGTRARLLSEGESEGRNPELSTEGLARWTSAERKELECPRCGARERIGDL